MNTRLIDKVNADLKVAMKEKDTIKKLLCQMLKSKFAADKKEYERKYLGIFDDMRAVPIVQKELKECDEEIANATTANREDLLENLKYKREILVNYLPEQMSDLKLLQEIIFYSAIIDGGLTNQNRKKFIDHILLLHPGQTTTKRTNILITQLMNGNLSEENKKLLREWAKVEYNIRTDEEIAKNESR